MLYVCPQGGWQSSWREPVYITVVVVGSVLVAVLLHLLMYSRCGLARGVHASRRCTQEATACRG